ncbi:MAG: hypothetical protein WDN69_04100 [Aliidongia sp.]
MLFNSLGYIFAFLPAVLIGWWSLARIRPPRGAALAYPRLAVLLWLVGLALSGAARRVDRVQLCRGACHPWRRTAAQAGAGSRHRRRSRRARLVQIRRFPGPERGCPVRHRMDAARRAAAARHFLLHLYPDRLPGRYGARQGARGRSGQYALFVTFFPHLLAGPVLHHRR